MANTIDEIANQAMLLPAEARARLADALVESLDTSELSSLDLLWLTEAKKRRDEARHGGVATIGAADAFAAVRRRISP